MSKICLMTGVLLFSCGTLLAQRPPSDTNWSEFIARYTPVALFTHHGIGELEHEEKVLSDLACGSAFYLPGESLNTNR